MTEAKAAWCLEDMIRNSAVTCDDPEQTAKDLLEWFNVSTPDWDDLTRLLVLFEEQQFEAWDCPVCEDRVYEGSPTNWGHFQGVWQIDRCSYPGNRHNQRCCDHCRMTMQIPEEAMERIRRGEECDCDDSRPGS